MTFYEQPMFCRGNMRVLAAPQKGRGPISNVKTEGLRGWRGHNLSKWHPYITVPATLPNRINASLRSYEDALSLPPRLSFV